MFTIDSNILIYSAAGDKKVSEFFANNQNAKVFLPTVVVIEVLSYPMLNSLERDLFESFFREMILMPLDFNIAEIAANLRKEYKITVIDSVVAATAYYTNSVLITRNVKHFKKIKEISVLEI